MSEPNTHLAIDPELVGSPVELSPGRATVSLTTSVRMAADERGLVHGGFVFGLADYAAMLAVNDPNVVLGSASARFVAPVKVGETLVAEAKVVEESGKKRKVEVTVSREGSAVLGGELTCFVLPKHVLD